MGVVRFQARALIVKIAPMRRKVSIFAASVNVNWWRTAIFQYRSMNYVVCSIFRKIIIFLLCCVDRHQVPGEQALLDQ